MWNICWIIKFKRSSGLGSINFRAKGAKIPTEMDISTNYKMQRTSPSLASINVECNVCQISHVKPGIFTNCYVTQADSY